MLTLQIPVTYVCMQRTVNHYPLNSFNDIQHNFYKNAVYAIEKHAFELITYIVAVHSVQGNLFNTEIRTVKCA